MKDFLISTVVHYSPSLPSTSTWFRTHHEALVSYPGFVYFWIDSITYVWPVSIHSKSSILISFYLKEVEKKRWGNQNIRSWRPCAAGFQPLWGSRAGELDAGGWAFPSPLLLEWHWKELETKDPTYPLFLPATLPLEPPLSVPNQMPSNKCIWERQFADLGCSSVKENEV